MKKAHRWAVEAYHGWLNQFHKLLVLQRGAARDLRQQMLFAGFSAAQRATLEEKADAHGLSAVQTVTKGLVFLCCGPKADPAKVEKSRAQGRLHRDRAAR